MNSIKNKTLSLLFLIFIAYGFSNTIIDPIIPILSERLNIGYDMIGLILLVGGIFAMISTFITGKFCDQFNLKKIIFIGIVLSIIGLILFTIYLSIVIFIFMVIFLRMGGGNLNSSIHAYTARIFYRKHNLIFMKLDIFWFIGAIICPLFMSIVLFLKIDIKIVFLILAVFHVILLILFYVVSPKNELDLRESSKVNIPKASSNDAKDMGESNNDYNNAEIIKRSTFSILKNSIIIISCFTLLFYLGIVKGLSSWLTTYYTLLNVSVIFSSVILSFFWVFSALGVFLNMKIIEMGKGNDISYLLFCVLLGVLSTLIYSVITFIYLKIIFLMLQALFYSAVSPLILSIAVYENPEFGGTIIGTNIAIASAGSLIFQPILGYIIQYFNKSSMGYFLIVTSVIELILVFILFVLIKKKYKIKFKIY